MSLLQWLTLAVFAVTIAAIVINKLDAAVAALLGVVVMVWMGTMTEVEAAQLVDWNVMAILVGIWIIAMGQYRVMMSGRPAGQHCPMSSR